MCKSMASVIEFYKDLQREIEGDEDDQISCDMLYLDQAWNIRHLLDGNKMADALGLHKKEAGPLMGKLLDAQIRWQLRNGATYTSSTTMIEDSFQEKVIKLVEYLKTLLPNK